MDRTGEGRNRVAIMVRVTNFQCGEGGFSIPTILGTPAGCPTSYLNSETIYLETASHSTG